MFLAYSNSETAVAFPLSSLEGQRRPPRWFERQDIKRVGEANLSGDVLRSQWQRRLASGLHYVLTLQPCPEN
jgi:hypothetical protein